MRTRVLAMSGLFLLASVGVGLAQSLPEGVKASGGMLTDAKAQTLKLGLDKPR